MCSKYKVGDCYSFSKTISEYDIYTYAGLSGDFNPMHINLEYAKKSKFKKRIAHGMLVTGLISATLGMYMPGPGTIYLEQNLHFVSPVYFNDTITAKVKIIEILNNKVAKIETSCFNQNGIEVINGIATVLLPISK